MTEETGIKQPNIEIRSTGFRILGTATVFVDGECEVREVFMPEEEYPNMGALLSYLTQDFRERYDLFAAEVEAKVRAHLHQRFASANGSGAEEG
jgi:hypothetical protein